MTQGAATPLMQALLWIGFNDEDSGATFESELGTIDSIAQVTHKDIRNLSSSYASGSQAAGRSTCVDSLIGVVILNASTKTPRSKA